MASADQYAKSAWMLVSIAVVVAALYLAQAVLVPLTLAVLLSFLLSPVCDWFERRRLGRISAVLVTAILGFTVLGVAVWIAVVQMTGLAPKIPAYQDNIQAKFHSVNTYFVATLSKVTRTPKRVSENIPFAEQAEAPQGSDERPYSVRVLTSPASPLQVLGGSFNRLIKVLGLTGLVIVLVVFFLLRREDLRDRFIRLVGRGKLTVTTQMLEDAAARVTRYLSMLFVVNATFGLAVGIGLYLIGVPDAILWGMLATTLRFIPYIGPWIAAAMPIALSLAISTGWGTPIYTVTLFVVLELFSNNVMEPWLYGKHTGVSAVAILVAAVFWTWLWGIAGLLLATPLTVCLLVLGKHVPELSFLDTLLGNEPVFEPQKRVYQRLLAGDQEEATELVEEDLQKKPRVDVYDTLLIPALTLAEVDWHRGELDETRHKFILQSLREIVRETEECQPDVAANEVADDASVSTSCILCLPARDEADAIAGMMLAQLLVASGCLVQSVPVATEVGEVLDLIEGCKAAVVCISASPPTAVTYARHLCKQLRRRFPAVPLVVGLWNARDDLNKAKVRIGGGDKTHVVVTLAEAQEQVRLLIAPRLPPEQPTQPTQPESRPAVVETALK